MNKELIPYDQQYRHQCIEAFESNIGLYFAKDELREFIKFLDHDVFEIEYYTHVTSRCFVRHKLE
ncbi:hypothetical protein Q4601_03530 [Shewanella sp. 1_MG-2023]|uniref:Uncharacterized protein n=1 Tax=Shewanella electrodiphila TaxID=934143 RepID=A0ABT0KPX0_9GAMM|nr:MULTISPECIES: hypothetical protein [Shewanella]MCL1045900.1 hypothetical protein [Shewanella electrodiphila]MDO6610926.1 hypothetical protein [Shewanella sp. 7_MG-2023]MDO6770223.1 hypothetical protein [Shewanella sp. 2_MG-2023]MDO6793364.1 hypothetical protein [Shewanella sp. 1_MG-2023]